MKKYLSKLTALVIAGLMVMMLVPLMVLPASADAWDGTTVSSTFTGEGTEASPYIIGKAADLAGLATLCNNGEPYTGKYFKLTTDIDLREIAWTPIGTSDNPFSGIFDGEGHSITGLNVNLIEEGSTGGNRGGLFGTVSAATIKNLSVQGPRVFSSKYTGGLVGLAKTGTKLIGCTTEIGQIQGTAVGGIVGRIQGNAGEEKNLILLCTSNSTVKQEFAGNKYSTSGDSLFLGGIVGAAGNTDIYYCTNNGEVTMTAPNAKSYALAGGIVGVHGASSCPVNTVYCVNTGNITCYDDSATNELSSTNVYASGGIVGRAAHVAGGAVVGCFNLGTAKTLQAGDKTTPSGIAGDVIGQIRDGAYKIAVFNLYGIGEPLAGQDKDGELDTTGQTSAVLSADQIKGNNALTLMNLGKTPADVLLTAVQISLFHSNYTSTEKEAMLSATGGKTLEQYLYDEVNKTLNVSTTENIWVAAAGLAPVIVDEAATKAIEIFPAANAIVKTTLETLNANINGTESTVNLDDVTAVRPTLTTKAPSGETETPSTDATVVTTAPTEDKGCGGIALFAQFIAILCGGAAFIVIKKK